MAFNIVSRVREGVNLFLTMTVTPKIAERQSARRRPISTQSETQKKIQTMKTTLLSLVAVLSLVGAALANQTPDHKVLVLKNKDGVAILGYDAVAYFTDNRPMK